MKQDLNEWTQKEFLSLPERSWGKVSTYDSIILAKTGKKHDSGFGIIAIIGCNFVGNEVEPVEIAAFCDHVWFYENDKEFNVDCLLKSGFMRIFNSPLFKIEVGHSLSSTKCKFIKK